MHTVPNVCYAGQNRAKSVNQVAEAEKAMLLVRGENADRTEFGTNLTLRAVLTIGINAETYQQ